MTRVKLREEECSLHGQRFVHVYIPESSQVHRCNGNIFDRNEDGDLNITSQTDSVAALFIRKQATYTENKIYPFVKTDDLRHDLLERVRKMIQLNNPRHQWLPMDDKELF